MSTTFAIDDGSAAQDESPTAEDDSIVYSRYSAMALQSHRPPTPRQSRRTRIPQAIYRSSASGLTTDDTRTAARCQEALRWITRLPEGAVRIQVSSGRVTLEGTVRGDHEREVAADTVRQVEGVAQVDNRIDIR